MRTRCPHCRQPIEIVATDPLTEIHCTLCGSTFSLATGATPTYGARQVTNVGQFELLEELGSGAFGSVWKAHDRELDRTVALKLPRQEGLDEFETERFLREARAAAQLHHPGIVSIHEIGRESGQIYIVSDFVQGATLADWVRTKPLTAREIAELAANIADALAHAHERGIVHRDLKPANILLDGQGRPHLTDFGLAKRDAGEVTMTTEGQILGTPAYMSPEQARGEGHGVDARADIYSLGVVLYELLSGELPFRGSSRMMILQIINDDPPSPRKLRATIPRDLETIALKCLEKDPARRYATAAELARDLRRWLAGEPIRARPTTRGERIVRWCRRNRAVAGLAAAAMVLLVVVAVVSTAAAVRLGSLAQRERAAKSDAEENLQRARTAVDAMLTEVGQDLLANVPYLESTRRMLLEKALAFYKELLETRPTDPVLRQELALAHSRVGRINALLGRPRDAESSYSKAIEQLTNLTEEFPENSECAHHLAVCHNELAELLRESGGQPAAAEAHYRSALAIQLKLAAGDDRSAEIRRELTRTYNNLGILLMDMGRLTDAADALGRAAEMLEVLVNEFPKVPEYQAELGRTQINFGVLSRKKREIPDAQRAYEQAIATLARLVEAHPDEVEYRYKLGVSQFDLANLVIEETSRPGDARTYCDAAKMILQELNSAFPGIPRYAQQLANVCITQANERARAGELDAASSAFEEALAHLNELEKRCPKLRDTRADFRSLLGTALGGMAWIANERHAPEEARRLVERAIEEQSAAVKLDPSNPKFQQFLNMHKTFLAQISDRSGTEKE